MNGTDGWRWWTSAGGAALLVLPLAQDAPPAAVVAALAGPVVVCAWAWGTRRGRTAGVSGGAALIAALVATFAVSQWPRGAVIPPWVDWFVGWLLIGALGLAALVGDRLLSPIGGDPPASRRWTTSVTVLAALLLLSGCGLGLLATDGDGSLRFTARADEVLPLPTSLRLVSADTCTDGGSSGNCTAEFVVTATDGADRATTTARLVAHLRGRGWPLQPDARGYRGARETGGILAWTPHRMWLSTDTDGAVDTTVTVHVGNL
ncbi:hypothetical protein [Micromonospora sediminicola]|uniref:hypothetical protein n=1 Tax=Micromonospora sediminicola TaxID=946078 RepID=UPI0037AD1CCE